MEMLEKEGEGEKWMRKMEELWGNEKEEEKRDSVNEEG